MKTGKHAFKDQWTLKKSVVNLKINNQMKIKT
jgi:hypothetical protein